MIKRSEEISVQTMQRGDGYTYIDVKMNRSVWKTIKVEGEITVLAAMAMVAVDLRTEGMDWVNGGK